MRQGSETIERIWLAEKANLRLISALSAFKKILRRKSAEGGALLNANDLNLGGPVLSNPCAD